MVYGLSKGINRLKKVVVVGGGLAGLVSAILLNRRGFAVTLIEKKAYPFHRVCGEYISNEVKPFLQKHNLFPNHVETSSISQFEFTSIKGRSLALPLDLGGFGVSRYLLDQHLAEIAKKEGVDLREKCTVSQVYFNENVFLVKLSRGEELVADLVIGAYGKNANLDRTLKRSFVQKRAPFIGVKRHIKSDFPKDKIALHNFENGYCGISAIENEKYNLCYLGNRKDLRKYRGIEAMEEATVKQNPHLKSIFENSDMLFKKPEVINEFSFAPKTAVENRILMAGDSAGLITPLCGNGMALAIHAAKIVSDCIIKHASDKQFDRVQLEQEYTSNWQKLFARRLWIGRQTQKFFGSKITSELTVTLMQKSTFIAKSIIKQTHGQPFD